MSGLRIKKYRTEKCYSQKQFASIVGVSTRTIVRWEQNETKPNPEEAERIAAIIGVTAEDLLSDTDSGEEFITTDDKITVLDRISENVNNLVTGQETINESLSWVITYQFPILCYRGLNCFLNPEERVFRSCR